MLTDPLHVILATYGLEIVPTRQRRRPGQTHAGGVLRQILRDHGPEHLSAVLHAIRSSPANAEALHSETIGAVSDVLIARGRAFPISQAIASIRLCSLRERAVRLRPWPVRDTLRAFLDAEIDPSCHIGPRSTEL